jgi:hypothetical protein
MFYPGVYNCISEKARILVKEKEQQYFRYEKIKRVLKLLEDKRVLYSLNYEDRLVRVVSVVECAIQNFTEVATFAGSRIFIGVEGQLCVDNVWLTIPEVEFHEKIFEYDILSGHFKETFITTIKPYRKKMEAFQISTEDDTGLIVDNLITRLFYEKDDKVGITLSKPSFVAVQSD